VVEHPWVLAASGEFHNHEHAVLLCAGVSPIQIPDEGSRESVRKYYRIKSGLLLSL